MMEQAELLNEKKWVSGKTLPRVGGENRQRSFRYTTDPLGADFTIIDLSAQNLAERFKGRVLAKN